MHIGILDTKGSESVMWNDIEVGKTALMEHWNHPTGSQQQVYTFTNAHSVELFVNGKSLGTQHNDGTGSDSHVIRWKDVDFNKGGILKAIARDEVGREVASHQIETAGKAVRLVVTPERTTWTADGMDLLYLNVTAVDRQGRVVPNFCDTMRVSIEGPASLLALDNGDHYTNDLFYGIEQKPMHGGRMQIVIRSGRKAGKIVVKMQTETLKTTYKTNTNEP